MKVGQAQAVIARITREYPGRIVATLDTHEVQPDGHGYRVALLLLAGQRRISTSYAHQVADIIEAWHPFLEREAS